MNELEQLAALGPGLAKILKGEASVDETLGFVEGFAKWLCEADPALEPKLTTAIGWIDAWRKMGPEGPFTPTPTWEPGPGSYRGR